MKEFIKWLEETKGFTHKSAQDSSSRLRRIIQVSRKSNVNRINSSDFENKEEFKNMSVSVRSQLRRTYNLYQEFSANDN